MTNTDTTRATDDATPAVSGTQRGHLLGCLMGVFVGDAGGAVLEFAGVPIDAAMAAAALRMPGGGRIGVASGQITDDGELALALLGVLLGSSASGLGSIQAGLGSGQAQPGSDSATWDRVAAAYARWYASQPFDCGNTCRAAFAATENTSAKHMEDAALKASKKSEANGALMVCFLYIMILRLISTFVQRIAPLAALMAIDPSLLPVTKPSTHQQQQSASNSSKRHSALLAQMHIAESARADARLSHPSHVTQDCNAVYCTAISHLINHPGDSAGAIESARAFVTCDNVNDWIDEATANKDLLADMKTAAIPSKHAAGCTMGHVKHAFMLAFHFLHFQTGFEDALVQTLMVGGDTDTNAAIVGGLMGAFHGLDAIPEYMRSPVMQFDCTNAIEKGKFGYQRPVEYSVFRAMAKVNAWCDARGL
ncbi:hypothetical protein HDU98_011917 [Podochytrium sp. JEL0797]|nr:hypothetical protein HDU98_011917 [Podochytrium sp. JEL0797]